MDKGSAPALFPCVRLILLAISSAVIGHGQIKPLDLITPCCRQEIQLLAVFHPFGQNLSVQAVSHGNNGFHKSCVIVAVIKIGGRKNGRS
jgi:hypothetical protein